MKQKTKFKQTEIGKIPEDWEVKKLEEVSKFQYGLGESAEKKGEFVYIRITDINADGTLNKKNSAYINKNKVKDNYVLKKGDVLVARTGATYGKTVFFNEDFNATYGGFLIRILLDKSKINNNFFFQFSRGRNYWSQATGLVSGGAQPQFNANAVAEIKVPLPPLPEQLSIAKILSSLDEKIELNNKMNKTLEAIGQALFKKWFIDNPEREDWEEGKLGDLGVFKNGINYLRNENGNTEFSIINVRNISNNKWIMKSSLDKININYDKAKDYLLKEKDIIIARSACPGKVSLVLGNPKNIIYSGFSIRYRLNDLRNYFYIIFILEGLQRKLTNFSIGTTLKSVNQEVLKNLKLKIPDEPTLKDFNKVIEPIFKKISVNCFQNQTLAQIRDALLPKLMSGEVRVK